MKNITERSEGFIEWGSGIIYPYVTGLAMKLKKYIIILNMVWAVLMPLHQAGAVVYPDRGILLNPLQTTRQTDDCGLFTMTGGWGEIDKKMAENTDDQHNWSVKLGAALELFRYRNSFSFTASSDIELVANDQSEMKFNPRSFFWQESFMGSFSGGPIYYQTGYVHRCKHDIDNIEVQDKTGEKRQAVFIYDSIFLRVITKEFRILNSVNFPFVSRFYIRDDYFVLRDDSRIYEYPADEKYSIENLINTVQAGVNIDIIRAKNFDIYTRLQYKISFFSENVNGDSAGYRNDYFAECGIRLKGEQGVMQFFLNYEYIDYTMINPFNEKTRVLYFGIRTGDRRMYN